MNDQFVFENEKTCGKSAIQSVQANLHMQQAGGVRLLCLTTGG